MGDSCEDVPAAAELHGAGAAACLRAEASGERGSSRSLGSWGERELLAELGKAGMCGRALLDGDGDLVLRRKASKGPADVSHPLG